MKKTISLLLVLILTLLLFACTKPVNEPEPSKTVETEEPAKTPEQTKKAEGEKELQHIDPSDRSYYDREDEIKEEIGSLVEKDLNKPLDISLYSDEEIRAEEISGEPRFVPFVPGIDMGLFSHGNFLRTAIEVMGDTPSNAWRDMENGERYMMIDTDKGARFYIFFSQEDNYSSLTNYVIAMTDKLSYKDFETIKVGDTIEDVEKIDKSARYMPESNDKGTYEWFENTNQKMLEKYGKPYEFTTAHLLTDGILKITYDRTGDFGAFKYTVKDIEFHDDFKVEGLAGVREYRIADIDYVD